MRIVTLLVAMTLLVVGDAGASESLCPPRELLPPGVDDMRLTEGHFTTKRYERALVYFETDLPKILHDSETVLDRLRGSAFWISYRNNLIFIRGHVLRERALSTKSPAERTKAVEEFCQFLSGAKWVD